MAHPTVLAETALLQFVEWALFSDLHIFERLHALVCFSIANRSLRERVRRLMLARRANAAKMLLSEILVNRLEPNMRFVDSIICARDWLSTEQEALKTFAVLCSIGRYTFEIGYTVSLGRQMRGRRVQVFVTSGNVTLYRVAYNDQVTGDNERDVGSVRRVEYDYVGVQETYQRGDTLLFDRETDAYLEGDGLHVRAVQEFRALHECFSNDALVPSMECFTSDILQGYLPVYIQGGGLGPPPELVTYISLWAGFFRSLSSL